MRRGLWALSAGVLLCACQRGPFITVHVSDIPASAQSLPVSLSVSGQPAHDVLPFDLGTQAGQPELSFGLRLPPMTTGALSLGVAAFDQAGGGGTLLAAGHASLDVADADTDIQVSLSAVLPQQPCAGGPFLLGVSPAQAATDSGELLHVYGWGFQHAPSLSVLLGTIAASPVVWLSAAEITARVPSVKGQVTLGPVPLTVQNSPQGCAATAKGLFSFYASAIQFEDQMTSYAAGKAPVALAAGHVAARPLQQDVIVASAGDDTISVLLNGGFQNGTLTAPAVHMAAGSHPVALALGDMDGDGTDDLVVANQGTGMVGVVLNQHHQLAQQDFDQALSFDAGVRPRALGLGTLRADGKLLDAAVIGDVGVNGVARVLLGDGHGKLVPQPPQLVGLDPSALLLASLRPGHPPDLLVGQAGSVIVSVLQNDGQGAFAAGPGIRGDAGSATLMAAGDVNGDQAPDLIVGNQDQVRLLLNDGTGNLVDRGPLPLMKGTGLSAMVLGDLNADGGPDLLVASSDNNMLMVLQNMGHGQFKNGAQLQLSAKPIALLLAQLDTNPLPDVLVALDDGQHPVTIDVLLNTSQ